MNTLLVGAGYWGKNFIRILEKPSNKFNLKYILDNQNQVQEYPCFQDLESLNEVISEIECAIVCTPTKTHFEIVKYLLNNNIHVLVEKPITVDVGEAKELYEISKNNLVLLTDHTFLYSSAFQYISEYIKSGELGELVHISFERTNLGPIRTDVSCLWDLSTHDISMLNSIISEEVLSLSASGYSVNGNDIYDMVNISIKYKDKFVSIFSSWLHPEKSRKIKFVGSEKMIIFDDLNTTEPVKIYNKKVDHAQESIHNFDSIFNFSVGEIISPFITQKEPLSEVINDFQNRILSKDNINKLNNKALTINTVDLLQNIEKNIKLSNNNLTAD